MNAGPAPHPAPLAYFWGDDAYSLDAAVEALRRDPARFPDGLPERWRVRGDGGDGARILAELTERLATGPMFGGGTLVVVAGLGQLVRRNQDRDALLAALPLTAPGNGFAVAEETDSGRKDPPSRTFSDAIRAAGGD
ncbi:MAG TPA: hypothetical protein VGQ85_04405, partial [Candidatus Limnocylindrales bacterium]|nr:hypothetical protein [Candidatus Limnocylindrales bacterium]